MPQYAAFHLGLHCLPTLVTVVCWQDEIWVGVWAFQSITFFYSLHLSERSPNMPEIVLTGTYN